MSGFQNFLKKYIESVPIERVISTILLTKPKQSIKW